MISRWMNDDILREVAKLQPIANDHGLTMAQLAIAWVLQNPNVSSAIIGASKAKQVKENVKAAGVKLSEDVMRAIDNAIAPIAERDPAKDVSPNPRP
jgi:aryl-alcohol dehydrogenase-like predicted oxidoreductase